MFKKNLIAAGMAAVLVIGSAQAAVAFGPSNDGGFGGGMESSFDGGSFDGGMENGFGGESFQDGNFGGMENEMKADEARPVDENGQAILADGEELAEPAEQLTGELPELPEGVEAGELPELPEGAEAGELPELPEGAEAGMQMNEARPVDENGQAILADGEELAEPAEQLTGELPELPEGVEAGELPELPEGAQAGMQMNEARPVDENGQAILADGEELAEPAEQLTGELPELPEGVEAGELPELPENADTEITEKGPGIDLMRKMRQMPPMVEQTEAETETTEA